MRRFLLRRETKQESSSGYPRFWRAMTTVLSFQHYYYFYDTTSSCCQAFSSKPTRTRQDSGRATTGTASISPLAASRSSSSSSGSSGSTITNSVSMEEDTTRDILNFDAWADACGVQKGEGIALAPVQTNSNNNSGQEDPLEVGMMTTIDLNDVGTPVLLVPAQMILSAQHARKERVGFQDQAEALLDRLGVSDNDRLRFYLMVWILQEWEAGAENSPYFPWMQALPRYFSNGASMTHFCCTNCLPPLVGQLAEAERTRFRQFFKALDFVDGLHPNTKAYKQLAKWAYNVVFTRSFHDGNGDYKIAPMGDMLNHDSNWNVRGSYDEEGNFVAYTTQPVEAGAQLCFSYTAGDPTNPSFLLARYGFLDESSPATFCKLMLPTTPDYQAMGYEASRMVFFKDSGDASQEVWDVLLYHILGEIAPSDQQALYQAHTTGDEATKAALHQEYSSQTLTALRQHVDSFLTNLEDLAQRTQGRDLDVHPRLPLIRRHNDFVKETFLRVQANLMRLQGEM